MDIEVAAGNNVLDGEAVDGLSSKMGKCEERLAAMEDFNKKVRPIIYKIYN